MQLDLSSNQLCGINAYGQGIYTAKGITAIAEALKVTGSLTSLELQWNEIGDKGAAAIAKGLSNNGSLTELNIAVNHLGPEGAKAIAKGLSNNGSLTKLDLLYNQLDESAKAALRAAARPALKLDL